MSKTTKTGCYVVRVKKGTAVHVWVEAEAAQPPKDPRAEGRSGYYDPRGRWVDWTPSRD